MACLLTMTLFEVLLKERCLKLEGDPTHSGRPEIRPDVIIDFDFFMLLRSGFSLFLRVRVREPRSVLLLGTGGGFRGMSWSFTIKVFADEENESARKVEGEPCHGFSC